MSPTTGVRDLYRRVLVLVHTLLAFLDDTDYLSIVSYAGDFIFSAVCPGGTSAFRGDAYDSTGYRCGLRKTDVAFSCVATVFWFFSGVLGLIAVRRLQKCRKHGSRV
ncbi:hypothetical protein BDV95DRAFT_591456 [Massariosphaeria phaeospora]|uniref:MARVEL domain-containing protein n=1 Tax=Massariosphaeria phaeospora TaxID=100035 RepID=A0A7C8IHZ0_9PLEO|nr:hypothetical protein BDV95DRAFT_591456 [Massariosphaeria phaeospora]